MSDGRAEILKADGLYHVYDSKAEDGNVVALRGLHVSVYEGEAVAVVGRDVHLEGIVMDTAWFENSVQACIVADVRVRF